MGELKDPEIVIKVCSCCGKVYDALPSKILGINKLGIWFDCDCGNTLLVAGDLDMIKGVA